MDSVDQKGTSGATRTPAPPGSRGRGRPPGDQEARRSIILAAGLAVLAEVGYASASLRTVAQRAGCTTGAVTYYFASKEQLLVALAEHLFDEFDALLGPAWQTLDVRQAFMLLFDRVRADSNLWLAQFQLLACARIEPACAAVFSRRYAAYREGLSNLIRHQQKAGVVRSDIDAELLADQLSAMGDGWMMLLPAEPDRFCEKRVDRLLDAVFTLLKPVSSAP